MNLINNIVPKHSKLKSTPSNLISFVKFVSHTDRKVSIIWVDYDGNFVSYGNIDYDQELSINTFPTHPWIFRDSISGDELVTSKSYTVYWPVIWDGESDADTVIVGIPIYPLKERCLQIVRMLFTKEQIKLLKLPSELIQDLSTNQNDPRNRILVNVVT